MRYLTLFIILFLFWLALTFELSPENLVTGAVVSIVATLFFGKYFVRGVKKFFQPARYFWLIIYLFVFIWECLKANFDVAYRVLHPAMPIKPGIVKVKLNLESDIGRTFLAMSITMTPGTIAVDIIDDHIYIHWIYISSTEPEVYSKKISGRFEKHLKRIFE
jgi:multicomponent Na+:H+ antiporter subunit E